MSRLIWYALYYSKDEPPVIEKVRIDSDLSDLRRVIYDDNITALSSLKIDRPFLQLYPVGTDVTTITASTSTLRLSTPVSSLHTTDEQPIIVVARPPTPVQSGVLQGTKPAQLDDPAFLEFINTLLATEKDDSHILDFGKTHIFARSTRPTQILVRECYDDLYELTVNSPTRSLLLGTPGIGKSLFGIYMLKRLLNNRNVGGQQSKQRTVVWISSRLNRCVIVHDSSANRYQIQLMPADDGTQNYIDSQHILSEEANWVIYDAVRPLNSEPNCKALLISSPRSEDSMYSEWRKGSCIIYYMPVWTDEEMTTAQEHIYKAPLHHYRPLRKVFGNIPRHVFEEGDQYSGTSEPDTESNATSFIEQLLNTIATLSNLNEVYGSISKGVATKQTHYLMHVLVESTDYRRFTVQFSSFVAEEMVMHRIESSEHERQLLWLAISKDDGEYGSLRGILFERYAHRHLQRYKGQYQIRRLREQQGQESGQKRLKHEKSGYADETLQLDIIEVAYWTDISEAAQFKDGVYGRPISRREGAIDSLQQPERLFQMTVSRRHGILLQSARQAVKVLRGKEKRLYFVVPSDKFNEWTVEQPYKKSNLKDDAIQTPNLAQYALQIDIQLLRQTVLPLST